MIMTVMLTMIRFMSQFTARFSLVFESQGDDTVWELQYLQCNINIRNELSQSAGTGSLAALTSLAASGCPNVSSTSVIATSERTCASGFRRREPNGVVVCGEFSVVTNHGGGWGGGVLQHL